MEPWKAMTTRLEPPALRETSEFVDGKPVIVRPIRADDADDLIRFHHRLSDTSILRRYFYPHMDLRAEEVTHLTQVDGIDRVALVVKCGEELIAVGRYDRLDDPTQAEVAFVVTDAFQHHGLATMLLHRLADAAKSVGITCLIAEVMAENAAMLSVFHAAGFPIESKCEWGTIELRMALTSCATAPSSTQTGTDQSTRVPPPSVA
jgi:RimJ/RimL family protein N-acetyltransferase